jgi:hypothetical protein
MLHGQVEGQAVLPIAPHHIPPRCHQLLPGAAQSVSARDDGATREWSRQRGLDPSGGADLRGEVEEGGLPGEVGGEVGVQALPEEQGEETGVCGAEGLHGSLGGGRPLELPVEGLGGRYDRYRVSRGGTRRRDLGGGVVPLGDGLTEPAVRVLVQGPHLGGSGEECRRNAGGKEEGCSGSLRVT